MDKHSILIIEDNSVTADTIALFVQQQGAAAEIAHTGDKGLAMARENNFDAIILDWMLPGKSGLQICREIRQSQSAPIIFVTAKIAEADIVAGLEAGADDYLCKPFSGKELIARIKSCLRRRHSFVHDAGNQLQVGDIELDLNSLELKADEQPAKLTKTEFLILETLMRSPGRIFTRGQLIDIALGEDFDGFERTVDAHISNLRKKMGEDRYRPRHIVTEVGIGYRFMP